MDLPTELKDVLSTLIQEKFPAEMISGISLESINVDHEAGEVRIVLQVSTEVAPEKFAQEYFGLTNLVQRTFKDRSSTLSDFFPIITPVFGQGTHA